MKNMKNRQQGLTFITWMLILAIGGFFVLLTLKLVPIYLENQSVKAIVQALADNPKVRSEKQTVAGIKELIRKGFRINNIYDFPKDAITVKKDKNRVLVDITYDRVEPIIHNVSVMVSFSEVLDLEIAVY